LKALGWKNFLPRCRTLGMFPPNRPATNWIRPQIRVLNEEWFLIQAQARAFQKFVARFERTPDPSSDLKLGSPGAKASKFRSWRPNENRTTDMSARIFPQWGLNEALAILKQWCRFTRFQPGNIIRNPLTLGREKHFCKSACGPMTAKCPAHPSSRCLSAFLYKLAFVLLESQFKLSLCAKSVQRSGVFTQPP